MDSPVTAELQDVLSEYDLGELVGYEKNERGFVNTAYAICTMDGRQRKYYFLRKYKRGIREEELKFEHSLIDHLVKAGSPVARIQRTRAGRSYLCRYEGPGNSEPAFYTVFEFLPGEDRFSWIDPALSEQQIASAAAVLAQLHTDGGGFIPLGHRDEPRILELLPVVAETWARCPGMSKGTVFDDRIKARLAPVARNIAATIAALHEPEAQDLPEMVIHCDYHPGNLKFSGEQVTGVFDFDWSKTDLRLFDVGLALWYFCTSWHAADDGAPRLDSLGTFLRAYQSSLAARPIAATIQPEEARYLSVMINAGNLYVLHWTILDYFAKDVDPVEYLAFLDHSLHFIEWFEQPDNRRALEAAIASAVSLAR